MNRTVIAISASLMLTAGIIIAQPRGPMFDQGRGEAGGPMPGLNLTDEQKDKMADLRVKHLKEVEPVQADLQKQHSALRLEMTAEKFNEARVKSIQSEIAKLQSDLGWKRVAHQRAVRDMLTPEQQKRFDARILAGGPGLHGMRRAPLHESRGTGRGMGRSQGRDAR
jgi:Spy/CpxP family protein refolding chaperone